ncbi:MAG: hypothetical protein II318_05440 [Bacteroidales bacterium]|nr:hypothetical protein [Bacteroidales bacterium]
MAKTINNNEECDMVARANEDYKKFNEHLDRIDATINASENVIESRTYEIGAGGLVVSLTILSLLRDTEHFPECGMIHTAIIWGLFTLCIILHYLSQFASKCAAEKMSKIIILKIVSNEKYNDDEINKIQREKFLIVRIFNKITPIILIIGIVWLISFTYYCFFRA